MGKGTTVPDPLHFGMDGPGFKKIDPDQQCPLLVGVSQRYHGLLAVRIYDESMHFYLQQITLP
jgi:hypothetical protein